MRDCVSLLSSYRHSSSAIAQGNDRRWWEGGGQQLMVKALEKNNFLNRDEKIEATHRRDREREFAASSSSSAGH